MKATIIKVGQRVKSSDLYELGDTLDLAERNFFGLPRIFPIYRTEFKAYAIGEYRFPKAGEWFISGAIPTAYKAPNDLSNKYWIAKLVRIKARTVYDVKKIMK